MIVKLVNRDHTTALIKQSYLNTKLKQHRFTKGECHLFCTSKGFLNTCLSESKDLSANKLKCFSFDYYNPFLRYSHHVCSRAKNTSEQSKLKEISDR